MNQAQGGNVIYKFLGDDKNLKQTLGNVKGSLGNVGTVLGALGGAVAGVSLATASALATITTASVKAYGEMEQLAGGAQKIFDEIDYAKIEKDAKEAYKTMNLSASEYLALINDVGATFASTMGDEKGYNTAKKGLQAISDYASGTGKNVDLLGQKFTMITRATSSYQSIADQFSGILPATSKDFLEQAQSVGILSNEYTKLTDVPIEEYQQAVSEMLERGVKNLGLANNTLTESTQTLTGSIATAKSALRNFLSGTGGIDEVVESVITAGTQIGKAVNEMLPSIVDGIIGIINGLIPELPGLIQMLLPTLLDGTVKLLQGLIDIAPTFLKILANMLPTLITEVINMFIEVANAFADNAPTIVPIMVDAIVTSLIALFENIDVILEACIALVVGLTNGIIQSLPLLINRMPEIVQKILMALIKSAPILLQAGVSLIGSVINGIMSVSGSLLNVGYNIINGIWNGIKNFDILGKVRNLARNMLNSMKNALGIHSPSTEFAWLGKQSMLGYTEQIEDMKGMLDDVIESTFSINPSLATGDTHYSPNVMVNNNVNFETDPLGQVIGNIKTFANGAKNDYNYGGGY